MPRAKRTFENDDDLFHRKTYAEFLKELILNCDSYHRDDDVKAYTIAMDSPWGTGKSVFLEKFESMLEKKCKDQLCVVHYNAWENDFWDNAFEPFADAVFSHPLFASPLADQTEEKAIKKVGSAVKHLAIAFAKKRLEDYFDPEHLAEAGDSIAGAAGAYVSQHPNAVSPAYSAYKENLKDMQDAMGTVLQEAIPGGKLVIIIDELDRCRPTFAIETLEIVKHVMDVPNVVYLFALDVKQLGAAIKKVYGSETDATGYLMRFFNYYSRLPEANLMLSLSDKLKNSKVESMNLLSNFSEIAQNFHLTVRDLETVIPVYKYMCLATVDDYCSPDAYRLYWTLLCFKYKMPVEFNDQMTGQPIKDERTNDMLSRARGSALSIYPYFKLIKQNVPFQECSFTLRHANSGLEPTTEPIFRISSVEKMNNESNGAIQLHFTKAQNSPETSIIFKTTDSLSGVLFEKDLNHWNDRIKTLTPGQFLMNNLEMYEFYNDTL